MLQHELEAAISVAQLASTAILKHYAEGFETEEKIGVDDHSEPVTAADREASRIIVDALAAEFPGDGILSEEETDDLDLRMSKRRLWIIDPIDGTSGFVNHDGDFAVQIGLADDGIAVAGVVLLPYHDVVLYASKGNGAFAIRGVGEPERVEVSNVQSFREMKLAMSRNHASPRMKRIIEHFGFSRIERRGSVGLKVGLIAERSCDIYIHPSPRTKLWDTCAPQIILEEAGGRFTDLFGYEMRYDGADLQNRNGILATNGLSHAVAVRHLAPILAEFGRVPHKH